MRLWPQMVIALQSKEEERWGLRGMRREAMEIELPGRPTPNRAGSGRATACHARAPGVAWELNLGCSEPGFLSAAEVLLVRRSLSPPRQLCCAEPPSIRPDFNLFTGRPQAVYIPSPPLTPRCSPTRVAG
ncbi:hypothetical protein AAFF_G00206510 [Aldrovandia affinis]|uniref:Uncharacterized protein n=1 Tax=Aldrovandia affinis TaxID=143900 RepID=A0AAD7RHI4_9TELE|nr:hypothetical protein AAFF_G00206510 [Aldrovandia affinis]